MWSLLHALLLALMYMFAQCTYTISFPDRSVSFCTRRSTLRSEAKYYDARESVRV
ncbi:hypothetical protein K523DRAFT_322892 [Schizophyllum commune Tattone D]|nr:hypothetical protein K523DRAFT_322892 [Schizophyllum commune Tattone D]